jgi:Mrp family chromosome partitioning ATPase
MLYILSFSEKINGSQLKLESSGKLKEILDSAKKNFDYVFIGSPPITKFPGAISIAGQADGTILIIDFGKTRKQVALKAKKNIQESNGKFIGTIINRRKYYIPEFLYKFI